VEIKKHCIRKGEYNHMPHKGLLPAEEKARLAEMYPAGEIGENEHRSRHRRDDL
jgi:hypothetical protein